MKQKLIRNPGNACFVSLKLNGKSKIESTENNKKAKVPPEAKIPTTRSVYRAWRSKLKRKETYVPNEWNGFPVSNSTQAERVGYALIITAD
jgi:hypothetical protein